MAFPTRRTGSYLLLVVVTTLLFTAIYDAGMTVWESRPQPLYRSLEVVIQSFTTTGYGEDAPWQTPQMNVLMILMQFAGIGLILTAVDIFAVPWLRDALSPTVPSTAPELQGHVIICGYTPRTDALITELDARGRPYVLIESETATATELHEADYQVIGGDPESTETLSNARIGDATVVVADAGDDANASIALSAHDIAPKSRVITLVTNRELRRYHLAAGVDRVLSPRRLLGRSLASQVSAAIPTAIEEGVAIGEEFELIELSVDADSEFANQTFGEASLRERFGINVIGIWFDGVFETPVDAAQTLVPDTRLLVAGESTRVAELRAATESTVREFGPQNVLLAGDGDTGQAAAAALADSGVQRTVLDIEPGDDVDVVGDARDPDALEAAGIDDADALILTVAEDTTAIFTTLIARELNPNCRILVRATEQDDVTKLYRAGADYVQSLAAVSGRMLAATAFEDEEVVAYGTQVDIVRLPADGLAGTTLAAENVRSETGCTVIAVLRDGETVTEFDPEQFTFRASDEVIIAGTNEAITRFENRYSR